MRIAESADKRKVSTDALETLGTIIGETEKRDAIHLAVEQAIAAHQLRPGEDVGFVHGAVGHCDKPLGIVDPFLKTFVKKGERFWLVLYPRTITSLRHVWSHPDFPEDDGLTQRRLESKTWIENYARTFPVRYEELLERAAEWVASGEYWCEGGRFEGEYVNDEFWVHYEIVTGRTVESSKRGNFFTCSC